MADRPHRRHPVVAGRRAGAGLGGPTTTAEPLRRRAGLGALLSGGRRPIWNRRFLAGALIAVAFEVPDLWWQARHHWAMFAMTRALNRENGGPGNIATWVIGQLAGLPGAGWSGWRGCASLAVRPAAWRALAWAYALLFVLFAVTTGAKIYYLAGLRVPARGRRGGDRRVAAGAAGPAAHPAAGHRAHAAVAVPIVLPVLPAADIGWTYGINPTLGESLGWPQLVQPLRGMDVLPPGQRAQRGDLHRRLRRGRRHQRTGPRHRAAHRRERAQHRLVVGPGQPARHHRGGHHARPRRRHRLRRLPPAVLHHVRAAATLSNPYGSATWNGAATSTCAPAPATRGAS